MLEKTEGTIIKNEQSRDTGNIGHKTQNTKNTRKIRKMSNMDTTKKSGRSSIRNSGL
jgi:hypothetical protein